MTKYFCRKCKIQMIIIEEDADKFTHILQNAQNAEQK